MDSSEFTRLVLGSRLTIEEKKKAIAEDISGSMFDSAERCEFRRRLWVNQINRLEEEAFDTKATQQSGVLNIGLKSEAPTSTSEAVAPVWQIPGLPQRNAGYSMALYSALKAAHSAGLPIPTARQVLEWWRNNPYPAEIEEVLTDEFKHYGTKNSTKAVNLRNLQKAINRMASARLMAP